VQEPEPHYCHQIDEPLLLHDEEAKPTLTRVREEISALEAQEAAAAVAPAQLAVLDQFEGINLAECSLAEKRALLMVVNPVASMPGCYPLNQHPGIDLTCGYVSVVSCFRLRLTKRQRIHKNPRAPQTICGNYWLLGWRAALIFDEKEID